MLVRGRGPCYNRGPMALLPTSLPEGLASRLDALFRGDAHARSLGIELVSWDVGAAVVQARLTPDHHNFLGSGHGAFTFSLADVAMSVASNSEGRICPAVHIDIAYLRAVRNGDVLVATATTTADSRRLGRLRLEVTVDGRPVASATGTTYRTDDWHFGAEAWPADWRDAH